ncbi:hypothetical protein HK405_011614, partial [Cladochytrium tenue]
MDVDSAADGASYWPPAQPPPLLPLQAPHTANTSAGATPAENASLQQQLHALQWQLLYQHAAATSTATAAPLPPLPPSATTSFVLPPQQLQPQSQPYPYRQAQ